MKTNILGSETFFTMNSERRAEVRACYLNQVSPTNILEELFFEVFEKSLEVVNYDYEISVIEPSLKDGNLYFKPGEPIQLGLKCDVWEELAKDFDTKHNSRMASVYEAIMFYTWRIAEGYLTLEDAAVDPSKLGNYIDSPNGILELRKTGSLESAGFLDGIGNTYSVTKFAEARYALLSGSWGTRESAKGKVYPLTSVRWYCEPEGIRYFGNVAVAKNKKIII